MLSKKSLEKHEFPSQSKIKSSSIKERKVQVLKCSDFFGTRNCPGKEIGNCKNPDH